MKKRNEDEKSSALNSEKNIKTNKNARLINFSSKA